MRIVIELLFTIVLAFVARAILSSVLKGVAQAGSNAYRQTREEADRRRRADAMPQQAAGTLHKDPVCGTFVPESTPYKCQEGPASLYFCSDACRTAYLPVNR